MAHGQVHSQLGGGGEIAGEGAGGWLWLLSPVPWDFALEQF